MKRLSCITGILFLSYIGVYGQISTLEEPISFKANVPTLKANESTRKILPSLDMKKIEREDKEDEANGIPPRFGYPHEVNFNLENSGEWMVLPDGDRIWRLELSCNNAISINLLYDKFWIPDGAKFFVYSNDHRSSIGAFTSGNNKGDRKDIQGFATGLVYGDQITLEYYLPKNVKEIGIISVAYVVHGYKYILLLDKAYQASGNCNININCSQGQNWQNEKNAIAMILVNGNRYCTGSLINTTANDGRPLFLTADHCLGGWANAVKHDAITAPNLSHWSFYWHYESPGCANTYDPPFASTSGANVIANNSISDFALLQLAEDPHSAAGVMPYYLGWDCSGSASMGGVGIHHPSGDIKKITPYIITPQSTNYLSNNIDINGNHWRITWSSGTTEGGSSGSPLINSNHRVIGQLHGGYASCSTQPQPDWYGKFNISWIGNGATDSRRRLSDWLDPLNTGISVLDGCNGGVNLTNQTVTSNRTINTPCNANVQNVTVTNGAKLTIEAADITINAPFEVGGGSELDIRAR